jgi:hypothetical protein
MHDDGIFHTRLCRHLDTARGGFISSSWTAAASISCARSTLHATYLLTQVRNIFSPPALRVLRSIPPGFRPSPHIQCWYFGHTAPPLIDPWAPVARVSLAVRPGTCETLSWDNIPISCLEKASRLAGRPVGTQHQQQHPDHCTVYRYGISSPSPLRYARSIRPWTIASAPSVTCRVVIITGSIEPRLSDIANAGFPVTCS